MKITLTKVQLVIPAIACFFMVSLTACHKGDHKNSGNERSSDQGKIPDVLVDLAKPSIFEKTIIAYGSLAPLEESVISVEVSGKLQDILVDIGSPIERGDDLAIIDSRDYESRLLQAEALLDQALARLGFSDDDQTRQIKLEETSPVLRANAILQENLRNLERARNLFNDGVVSQSEIESAQTEYMIAVNQHQEALNESRTRLAILDQRRAELAIAQQALVNTRIKAPFRGMIQNRFTSMGEYLNTGDPIVTIVRTDILRLQLRVTEKDSYMVRNGQKVIINVTGQDDIWEGVVKRISPKLNESSRMLLIEAEVMNDGHLRAGQHVVSKIIVDDTQYAIGVPEACIVRFAGIEKVVCVENQNAVEKRVITGRKNNGTIEIISGLKSGDQVILNPGSIRSGQVRIVTPS